PRTDLLSPFYGRVAPPLPHPFPTRRSSDLARRRLRRTGGDSGRGVRRRPVRRRRTGGARPAVRPRPRHGAALAAGRGGGQRAAQDRKSTRLNSSHVESSYAVFCVKKKTRNT